MTPNPPVSPSIRIGSVLKCRCPSCHRGRMTQGIFGIRPQCPVCGYNAHAEPGYFLGAMMVSSLATAMLMVPPMIILKVSGAEVAVIIACPFVMFLFLGPFLLVYSRMLWLHLEFAMSHRLDGR